MEISVIRSAIEQLSQLLTKPEPQNDAAINNIPIKPFVSLCNSLVLVLDEIGPTMAVLRQEIGQNIQRIEMAEESDPSICSNLVEILKKEANQGSARAGSSCSRAFLWLTRSLDFTVALLEKISNEPGMNMEQAVEESYNLTLKPWHGWISSAAYKIALKMVPDTATFINIIMENEGNHETLIQDIHTFIPLLSGFLQQAHSFLRLYNLERIKST